MVLIPGFSPCWVSLGWLQSLAQATALAWLPSPPLPSPVFVGTDMEPHPFSLVWFPSPPLLARCTALLLVGFLSLHQILFKLPSFNLLQV